MEYALVEMVNIALTREGTILVNSFTLTSNGIEGTIAAVRLVKQKDLG
jgi:hypothetical protein